MLDVDRDLVEKFEISDAHELHEDAKRAFVEEQVLQVKKMAWRLRVDIMVLTASKPQTDDEEAEKANKIRGFEKELAKYTEAINSFNAIIAELS